MSRKTLVTWLLIVMAAGSIVTLAFMRQPDETTTDLRVQQLARQIRCAECVGQSVAESNSSSSIAQRDEIRRLVIEGRSADEIRTVFVDTYGTDILLLPDATGATSAVWVIPVLVGFAGVGALTVVIRRWSHVPAINLTDQQRSQALTRLDDEANQ
jgi:cytochrome c-type biogenesis protein CcmH/NrfF